MRGWRVLLGFATVLASAGPGVAQGIDCAKAHTGPEKSICASPGLLALDHQVATAYAAAVGRQPERTAQMRQDLIAWLRQRDAACHEPAGMEACLTRQLTERLAALTPLDTAKSPAPPAAARMPVVIPSASDPPQGAARLEVADLPALEQGETLVHVTSPGRFTISAHSQSGAALQLVDMLAGPSDVAGVAGAADGRLDQLLDVGTYKLRVLSAPGSAGRVALTLSAFHDAAPPAALPGPDRTLTATLADGGQLAFWLSVPETIGSADNVRIEAAGRALGDLRLWRNGRELTDLAPEMRRISPKAGRAMTDLRLNGHVEPGTYLAVAYGGPSLAWTDNDNPLGQPFYLRAGASSALTEGLAGGFVGPFGSEVFARPTIRGILQLNLPALAPATLKAGDTVATINQKNRAPSTRIAIPAGGDGVVELQAEVGQQYLLRMIGATGTKEITKPGTYFVTAVTDGLGGDEPPPAVLLQRVDATSGPPSSAPGARPKPPVIVASTLPKLGAEGGWHARFNLHGDTSLLFQSESGGEVSVRSSGVEMTTIRTDNNVTNLPPGIVGLNLHPRPGVQGILDLIVGRPGQTPPLQEPLPPDPALPLGVQTITRGQRLSLVSGEGPGISVGLSARPVPVALVEGPLTVTIAAGAGLSLPVQIAPGGHLVTAEMSGGHINLDEDAPGPTTVTGPSQDHGHIHDLSWRESGFARTLVLAWRRDPAPPPPIAPPPPLDQTLSVQAGTPTYFDLARGETRGFTLNVAQGGLYRIETLGRLHTSGRLATPFIAKLGEADGNGAGQNMLMQSVLRAGRYRVDVQAQDSTGHVGLAATPSLLLTGATLLPGGSVRASLPEGTGVVFPIEVGSQAPRYRLNVDGLGDAWTGRMEDAEGWPLMAVGPLDGIEQALAPGKYRLVVAPDVVARQVVARLTPLPKPVEITGHGPHDLPFGTPQIATWREPGGPDEKRTPDTWRFALAGAAQVNLQLGDGMVAELRRTGSDAAATRIVGSFRGRLEAGAYTLEASSLGRNDRLVYNVKLESDELQPGVARDVAVPGSATFEIAQPLVVSLTSFGTTPVRAVLRRDDGIVIARYGAREDDWNIAVSRLLPAGRYRLDLRSATAPDGSAVDAPPLPSYAGLPADDSDNDSNDDPQKAQTGASQSAVEPKPTASADTDTSNNTSNDTSSNDTSSNDTSSNDGDKKPSVSLLLALPEPLPDQAAPATAAELSGLGVHVLRVEQPAPGSLLVAQATSTAALVLALERQGASQGASGWETVAIGEGSHPVVASPADNDTRPWRIEVWAVDGGPEPIRFAARAIAAEGQAPSVVALAAQAGMPGPLAVAHVKLGQAGPVALTDRPAEIFAGGWAGHALAPVDGDTVMLPGDEVWLLAPKAGQLKVQTRDLPAGEAVTLSLPEGLAVPLPQLAAASGHVMLWRAESGLGQPGLGAGMGVAPSSALAMGQELTVLRNASDDEALRLRLTRLEPTLAPALVATAPLHLLLQPGSAVPVTVPEGDKRISFDLAAGTAGIVGWTAPGSVIAWAGGAKLSRSVAGAWRDILLVNTGTGPAPVTLAWQAQQVSAALRPGGLIKRFFGAAGSFEIGVEAPAGARFGVAGEADLTVIAADGSVRYGRNVTLGGSGRVIVRHGVGAMAVWAETDTQSPWPQTPAQAVSIPSHLALSGPAMALSVAQTQPVLLHVTTTSPVLMGLKQQGRVDAPALFAAGASFHRMVAAGAAELRIYAPQDGPLSGSLDLTAEPIIPVTEGLGQAVTVAPGGTAVFGFSLAQKATIGVGVRADPDRATVRLLDASGKIVGEGVAQLRTLAAGSYVIEAQVAPDAPPTTLRPAVIGITPRGNGPPPDVAAGYLALVGMKLQEGAK